MNIIIGKIQEGKLSRKCVAKQVQRAHVARLWMINFVKFIG